MADMFEAIDSCPVPVIARVHGAALGGGMGLCAVSDLVIAESGTRFGFTETRLGSCRRSSPRSSSPRSARRTPGRSSPAVAGSTPCGPSGSGSSTRSSRARPRSTRRWSGRRRPARRRPDGRPGRQGDRPRGPWPAPRLVEVAHGPGHRPPAPDRRGPGGLPGVHREAPRRPGHPTHARARTRTPEPDCEPGPDARCGRAACAARRCCDSHHGRTSCAGLPKRDNRAMPTPDELSPEPGSERASGPRPGLVQRWIADRRLPGSAGRWPMACRDLTRLTRSRAGSATAETGTAPGRPIRTPVHRQPWRDRGPDPPDLRPARHPGDRPGRGRPAADRPPRRRRRRRRRPARPAPTPSTPASAS